MAIKKEDVLRTKKDLPFGFKSPMLIGGEDFVITRDTIPRLLGQSQVVTFNLTFVKIRNKLPQFGMSTVPANVLLALTTQKQCSISDRGVIKKHTWMGRDSIGWSNRNVDNNNPIVITFRIDASNPNAIELVFAHDNIRSFAYTYFPNKLGCETYFIIFVPRREVVGFLMDKCNDYIWLWKSFSLLIARNNQRNVLAKDQGRVMLLSNYDYLTKVVEGIQKKSSHSKTLPNECISCCSRLADIVFIPCGHTPFCYKCANEYLTSSCAICKQSIAKRETARRAAKFCLTCPAIHNCQEVNAMLLPCCCVVGCIEMTRHSIRPGEECINCDAAVSEVQQIYN